MTIAELRAAYPGCADLVEAIEKREVTPAHFKALIDDPESVTKEWFERKLREVKVYKYWPEGVPHAQALHPDFRRWYAGKLGAY